MIFTILDTHPWLRPVVLVALDVTAKSGVLLALALATAAILGSKRLLARSALWNACVLGLLVLPITSACLPRLRIAILPPAPRPQAAESVEHPAPVSALTDNLPAIPLQVVEAASYVVAPPPPSPPRQPVDWILVSLLSYAAIAALLALRLALAMIDVHRLRRSARTLSDPYWQASLATWTQRLDVPTPVQLLASSRVSVPIAFGWLRPAIAIPARMVETTIATRRSCILLHELAHVRRNDYLWQILLKVLQIVYWPNPLIWLAGRQIVANREETTDALCVYHAGSPDEYHSTLIEVARSLVRRPAAALGIAMARSPRIAQRLERMNQGPRVRSCLAGRPVRSALAINAVLIAAVVGACQLAPKENAAPTSEPIASVAQPNAAQPTRTRSFVLLVVGKDRMTFQGEEVTWDEVHRRLGALPDPRNTVFEIAVDSPDVTMGRFMEAQGKALDVVKAYGLEYVTDTGVKPLGSKGDAPQQVPAESATRRKAEDSSSRLSVSGGSEATAKGPRVRLASGAEVELLGIRSVPDGDQWWGLDGKPLKEAPCDAGAPSFAHDHPSPWATKHAELLKQTREYQFAARMTGPHGRIGFKENPLVYTWRVQDGWFSNGNTLKQGGQEVAGGHTLNAAIRADRRTTDIRIGIGKGTWETRGISHGEMTSSSNEGITVSFSAATEKDRVTTLIVTDGERDRAFRVLAIDDKNQEHVASCGSEGMGEVRKNEARFTDLPLKRIKEFRFQTMEYDWATFNEVPLQPKGVPVMSASPPTSSLSELVQTTRPSTNAPKGLMSYAGPDAPPAPRNIITATGSKATLPSGATVEFLGIHALPEKAGWWGLDGSDLKEAPCDPGEPRYWDVKKEGGTVVYPPDVREYQFVLRVTGPNGIQEVFPQVIPWTSNVEGARHTQSSAAVSRNGQPVVGQRSVQSTCAADRTTTTMTLGLASGKWKTLAASTGGITSMTLDGHSFLFSNAAENQGSATVSVTDNPGRGKANRFDNVARIVAIDTNNQIREAPGVSSVTGEGVRLTQAIFPNLRLRDVKEFQFQTCDYEWVRFPDIPLKPGIKTTRSAADIAPDGIAAK